MNGKAIHELKRVLACDEAFRLEWCGAVATAVALVRHVPTGQDRYIASVAELEEWCQALQERGGT